MFKTSFFLFSFIIFSSFTLVHGETMQAYLLAEEEKAFQDDEIALAENETLDLEPVTVPETTETVAGQEVDLTKEVEFIANDADFVSLTNTALPSVIVAIPDNTNLRGPSSWNGEITPPKTITTSGSVPSNFQTPTTSILVGSPDVILVFDDAVTILLTGTTGQTAYKTPGSSTWILISGCTGTYEKPDNPPDNGECSISDGTNTKILTFHFTEFSGLNAATITPTTTTPSTSSNSGGHGNTGVGSPRIFGSSSGSSGGGYNPGQTGPIAFPAWFDNVSDWYREGKISAIEFLKAYQWIVENVL